MAAVTGGLLSIEEACERYDLSLEEFMLWQESRRRSGMLGLRVTSVQYYRALHERQDEHKPGKSSLGAVDE